MNELSIIVIGILVLALVFCFVKLNQKINNVKEEEIQHELDVEKEIKEVYENMTKLVHEIDRLHDIVKEIK